MICIICAMSEERDAFIDIMDDIKETHLKNMMYHGSPFDNKCILGKIANKDVAVIHCGVGKVYASILTTLVIEQFKPELVINVGCAGSLNKDINVGDVVIADRVADWEIDVPGWERSIQSDKVSYACDGRFNKQVSKLTNNFTVKIGNIVSSDQFIYKKDQVDEILEFFPNALCGEMEGVAVAATCYAFMTRIAIVRSISDCTLVNDDYKNFDFNLELACKNAAKLCGDIIKVY